MEPFSALLALCAGNSPVPVNSPHKGQWRGALVFPFDVSFDLRLNKRLSKQSRGWWFETPSWSLWRHCCVKIRRSSDRLFFIVVIPTLEIHWWEYKDYHCTLGWPRHDESLAIGPHGNHLRLMYCHRLLSQYIPKILHLQRSVLNELRCKYKAVYVKIPRGNSE